VLARDLTHELGEAEKHVQGEAPYRGRRVELLRHGNDRGLVPVEELDDQLILSR
jgi:hypothetical protein